MGCFRSWNVDSKLFTLTVDSYTTDDLKSQILLHKLFHTSLLLGGKHMHCFTCTVNLIVKEWLEVLG